MISHDCIFNMCLFTLLHYHNVHMLTVYVMSMPLTQNTYEHCMINVNVYVVLCF